jgi:hypothetical protein
VTGKEVLTTLTEIASVRSEMGCLPRSEPITLLADTAGRNTVRLKPVGPMGAGALLACRADRLRHAWDRRNMLRE